MRLEWAHVGLCAAGLLLGCGSPVDNDFFNASPSGKAGATGGAGGSSGDTSSAGSSVGGGGMVGMGGNGGVPGGGAPAGGSGPLGGDMSGFSSNEEPIDDMEDGDGRIIEQGDRDGFWFISHDGTGWTNPEQGGLNLMSWNSVMRGQSVRSIEVMGGNHTDWGVLAGFNFKSGDSPSPYNLGAYSGVSFYAKSGQGMIELTVSLPDITTAPMGGICGSVENPCYQHSHAHVMLTNVWQKFKVPFSSLVRDGAPGSLSVGSTYGMQFSVAGNVSFDIWLDDVAFIRP